MNLLAVIRNALKIKNKKYYNLINNQEIMTIATRAFRAMEKEKMDERLNSLILDIDGIEKDTIQLSKKQKLNDEDKQCWCSDDQRMKHLHIAVNVKHVITVNAQNLNSISTHIIIVSCAV